MNELAAATGVTENVIGRWDMTGRSYGQYCPMARATEILGDRWTLLIVRDLLLGVHHFNEIERGLPGIPRALLARRLRQLEQVAIVERRASDHGHGTEYHLTPAGHELQSVVDALIVWGTRWAFGDPEPVELDPVLLLWWMHNRIHRDRLPEQRVVVRFDFRGARTGPLWLILERSDVSVCKQHPGYDVDLIVSADIAAFYRVWLGRTTLDDAVGRGLIQIDGLPALVEAFPTWLALSPIADTIGAVAAAAPSSAERR